MFTVRTTVSCLYAYVDVVMRYRRHAHYMFTHKVR